jgi:hypothetical protein
VRPPSFAGGVTKAADSPLATPAAKPGTGLGFLVPFGLLFIAIGLAAGWAFALRPVLLVAESRNWESVPCEILSSKVDKKSDSDGSTYQVQIRYRYTFQGRRYTGDRYDFGTGHTNVGVGAMHGAVKAHPPGARKSCWVDPAHPEESVLQRSLPSGIWLGALFGLVFPAAGVGVIWSGVRARSQSRAESLTPLATALPADAPPTNNTSPETLAGGEGVIKPSGSRLGATLFLGLFTGVWNTAVGYAFVTELRSFHGGFDWFCLIFLLFLVPFVLTGLVLLLLAFHAIAATFSPRMELRLDPSLLRLGSNVPFRWRFDRMGFKRLQLQLEAREEDTGGNGKHRHTARPCFHQAALLDLNDPLALVEGRSEFTLPLENVLPTLAGKHRRIVWELVARCTNRRGLVVTEQFPLPVRGPERTRPSPANPALAVQTGGGISLLAPGALAPGETLVGNIVRDAVAQPGALTLRLGWFREIRDSREAEVVWTRSLPELAPGTDCDFEVPLPSEPWTAKGNLVTVEWHLEVLDAAGVPLVTTPIVIAPGGVPVTLQSPAVASGPESWKTRLRGGR